MTQHSAFILLLPVLIVACLAFWFYGKQRYLSLSLSHHVTPSGGMFGKFTPRKIVTYLYARWPEFFLGFIIRWIFPIVDETTKQWMRDHYHGKVLTQELAEAIITINQGVPLQDLEQIIPYATARDIVLNVPLDIVAYECTCRRSRPVHCEPTQVCMIIGQPFADFTLQHNPEKSRRLSTAEALKLLREEHERGHIHAAYFKEDHLNRFYVICNCCKCCCGGIEAMVKYKNPIIAPSGYIARPDEGLCVACGACLDACAFGALSLTNTAVVDWEKCLGCGVCTAFCPQEAIELVRDERKGVPMDVRLLPKAGGMQKQPVPGEVQPVPAGGRGPNAVTNTALDD
jgi:ferredoxin